MDESQVMGHLVHVGSIIERYPEVLFPPFAGDNSGFVFVGALNNSYSVANSNFIVEVIVIITGRNN